MGLVGLMNTLKIEGGRKGIKVNTIAPVAATRMTADLGMPEEVFKALKPELVTPAVLFLCSEDAPSGAIIEAGAGYFAGVQVMESKGVHLGDAATVDDVAAAYDRIADMREATPFSQGAEVTQKIFASGRG
jgi:NAD(P)-dependent dehydrogenase (short-subunit alcohol dehydrogenase family)